MAKNSSAGPPGTYRCAMCGGWIPAHVPHESLTDCVSALWKRVDDLEMNARHVESLNRRLDRMEGRPKPETVPE